MTLTFLRTRVQRFGAAVLTFAAMANYTSGQVRPPKNENRIHHLFAPHRDSDNLEQRFSDLKCALVLIQSGQKLGTGFYVSADGDLVTASHVVGDRTFSRNPDSSIRVSFAVPRVLLITNSKGEKIELPAAVALEQNPDAWLADVALLKTGKTPPCWLARADDRKSEPGEHLITMGFPGLSFETLTIYEGIMSARLTTNLPTIMLDTGQPVLPPNEFIRVQMPISTGLSGAPIIDDENRAVAIVTNAGGWSSDLDHLVFALHGGAFQAPPPPQGPTPPGTTTFSINLAVVTAELADLFHDYASPGYGDAVPLRYLQKTQQQNQPSASPGR